MPTTMLSPLLRGAHNRGILMLNRVRTVHIISAFVLIEVLNTFLKSAVLDWLSALILFAFLALAVFGKFVAPSLRPTPFVLFCEGLWPKLESLSLNLAKVVMIIMLALLVLAVIGRMFLG